MLPGAGSENGVAKEVACATIDNGPLKIVASDVRPVSQLSQVVLTFFSIVSLSLSILSQSLSPFSHFSQFVLCPPRPRQLSQILSEFSQVSEEQVSSALGCVTGGTAIFRTRSPRFRTKSRPISP